MNLDMGDAVLNPADISKKSLRSVPRSGQE